MDNLRGVVSFQIAISRAPVLLIAQSVNFFSHLVAYAFNFQDS